jgi:hypothetical protein
VKAIAALECMGVDPTAREIYEAEEKARMVDSATIQFAEERAEKRGIEQGIERGIERGIEQGIEQGMLRGQQHLLHRQLTRHLGEVPPNVAAGLDTLTLNQLEDLGEALFDLKSYADIEAWLSRE